MVDAPPEPEKVGAVLAEHDLAVVGILLTHGHVDHSGGSGALAGFHRRLGLRASRRRLPHASSRGAAEVDVRDDAARFVRSAAAIRVAGRWADALDLAGFDFEVRHTPGHTPGHCCFFLADQETLFSGDQLFAGSIGRYRLLRRETGQALFRSMRER